MRQFFNFPMMPRHEYSSWIDRITRLDILEDIIYTCECELKQTRYSYSGDLLMKRREFMKEVKAYASNRTLELAILLNHTDTNSGCNEGE